MSRAEYERNLEAKRNDSAFMEDILPLLPAGVVYDPVVALNLVLSRLIVKLPGEPWKGKGSGLLSNGE